MTHSDDQEIINAALKRQRSTTTVSATEGVLPLANLRSWDNWRAFVHQITPIIVGTLVGFNIITDTQAALWISLVFAVLDPVLSVGNTVDKVRKSIYAVLGILQTGGMVASLIGGYQDWIPIAAAGVTILNATLARFYTPTTTLKPTIRR